MSIIKAILSALASFFDAIGAIFTERNLSTQTDVAVSNEAEQMQSDIAQKQTSRPESPSDVLKRLKDHDA